MSATGSGEAMPAPRGWWSGAVSARLLVAALVLTAAWQVGTLALILWKRFSCPLDLELLESAHVYHAWRLAHGLPIYGDPAAGFVTFPYPPLYWIALEGAAVVLGYGDPAGRAVSIASLFLAVAILGRQVARAAPSRSAAVLLVLATVAGICAGYPASDGSYDWARPDTLALMLAVLAGALARDGSMPLGRAMATALALAASIYAKQSGVFFALWLVGYALWRDRRGGIRLALATGAMCLVPFVALEIATHGWFARWLLYPRHQPLRPWLDGVGSVAVFLLHAPFVAALPWFLADPRRRARLRPTTVLWVGMFGAGALAGGLFSFKEFCCANIWIPALVLAWPVGAMVASDWLRGAWVDRTSVPGTARALLGASSVLLALYHYDAAPLVPSADRWAAAARLDDIVRGLSGGVVVTTVPMVAILAGDRVPQPILPAYEDARRGGIPTDYVGALKSSGARWVITTGRYAGTDSAPEPRMPPAFVEVATYDFDLRSLATWDHPTPAALWRRTSP